MKSYKVIVSSTRSVLIAPDNITRTVYVHHDTDADIVHIGGADVTVDNGFHIHRLETLSFVLPANESLYAIKDDSGDDISCWVLIPNQD